MSGSSLPWRARWSSAICPEPAWKAVAYWLTNSCASNEPCPGAQDQHQCVVARQSSWCSGMPVFPSTTRAAG